MRFEQTKLANGLTVIGEIRESAASVALGFFVKTGARDETPELSGVSHFLEHMMFKGTDRRTALDITYDLSAIGAQANAFTSEENTVYYAAVLPEYFADAFDILGDMLRPKLDQHEFDTEKKVILEEIALYKDRPSHLLFEAALREFFKEHPAGNPVLGSTESVGALSSSRMRSYFDRRYTASNIVLTAAGNFNWNQLVDLAGKYCLSWPAGNASRTVTENKLIEGSSTLTKQDLQCAHACFVSPGPSAEDELRYPIHVLSCILGDSDGSRAYWELIDKGLADSASVDADQMDGTGLVYGYVSADPSRIEEVKSIMHGILSTPLKFSDGELERAVTKLRTRLVLQGESSMRRLMAVGMDWIYRSRYSTLEEELGRLKSVDRSAVEAAVDRFSFKPVTTVTLLPA